MDIIYPLPKEGEIWPTLGWQVIEFMESNLVFGPGPLSGQPYRLRQELKYILLRLYEHYPEGYIVRKGSRTFDMTGRRRFSRGVISVAKGLTKTELSSAISITELHPFSPVRFNGYDPSAKGGMAPGRAVPSPLIPLISPSLERLNDLAYGACQVMAREMSGSDLFDVTDSRIMVNGEKESKIVPMAANPLTLDGLKPTFMCIDESHRLYSDRHKAAFRTVIGNIPKRYDDDPWVLTTTTAGNPSQHSVAQDQYNTGMLMYEGKVDIDHTFFFHRQTSDENAKFDTMEQRIIALEEASGPEAAAFRDLYAVAQEWDEAGADRAYLERVWCNRWTQGSNSAFDVLAFEELSDPDLKIMPGANVVLGFDGARTNDSTAIVMTEIETGIQNLVGLWEKPVVQDSEEARWEVPVSQVDDLVRMIFEDYNVWAMYADPPYWEEHLSIWSERWEGKIIDWPTKSSNRMYYAILDYASAIETGQLGHDGNPDFIKHISHAGKNYLNGFDENGNQKFRLVKIEKNMKYDAAVAAILSWQARIDALEKGDYGPQPEATFVPFRIR